MYNSIITENLWTGSHRKDQGEPSPPSRSKCGQHLSQDFPSLSTEKILAIEIQEVDPPILMLWCQQVHIKELILRSQIWGWLWLITLGWWLLYWLAGCCHTECHAGRMGNVDDLHTTRRTVSMNVMRWSSHVGLIWMIISIWWGSYIEGGKRSSVQRWRKGDGRTDAFYIILSLSIDWFEFIFRDS